MSYLAKYKKSDFKRISWEEYGRILDTLYKSAKGYIESRRIKFDAVVPILRGGAYPGTYLAFKFNMLRILPVQYKYFFVGKKLVLKKLFGFRKSEIGSKRPTFLLVENNHCFGITAETAAKDLKKMFPKSRIIYAADCMDYPYRKAVKHAVASFHGRYTNECRALTPRQCKRLGIANVSNLFPWETLNEEFTTVSGKQFKYSDVGSALRNSKTKKTIKL